jgi:hypothetical protein
VLFGFETKQALLTGVWFDTWHNGEWQRAVESVYERI